MKYATVTCSLFNRPITMEYCMGNIADMDAYDKLVKLCLSDCITFSVTYTNISALPKFK